MPARQRLIGTQRSGALLRCRVPMRSHQAPQLCARQRRTQRAHRHPAGSRGAVSGEHKVEGGCQQHLRIGGRFKARPVGPSGWRSRKNKARSGAGSALTCIRCHPLPGIDREHLRLLHLLNAANRSPRRGRFRQPASRVPDQFVTTPLHRQHIVSQESGSAAAERQREGGLARARTADKCNCRHIDRHSAGVQDLKPLSTAAKGSAWAISIRCHASTPRRFLGHPATACRHWKGC